MTVRIRHFSKAVFLKRILDPQAVLLAITLIYFLTTLIFVLGQKDDAFIIDKWGFFRRSMINPLLLVLSSVLILIGRLPSIGLALTITGGLIYVMGYRGLVGISHAHDAAALSLDALKLWFYVTPTNLIVQTGLAAVILIVGTIQLWRRLRKRRFLRA